MVERRDIRISDRDRQLAADRLKWALDEGRLDLFEYDTRLAQAYQSATYADLDPLFQDLPATGQEMELPAAPRPAVRRSPSPAPARPPVSGGGLPLPLKVLWTVYAAVLAINLVVWTLVSLGNSDPHYFWPMWLLVPGTALTGVTLGVQAIRRGRAAR